MLAKDSSTNILIGKLVRLLQNRPEPWNEVKQVTSVEMPEPAPIQKDNQQLFIPKSRNRNSPGIRALVAPDDREYAERSVDTEYIDMLQNLLSQNPKRRL